MDNTTKMIVAACSVGAAIGGLIMLMISSGYAWIGIPGGAAAGFLAYNFQEVLRVIPGAWRATVLGLRDDRNKESLKQLGWWFLVRPYAHLTIVVFTVYVLMDHWHLLANPLVGWVWLLVVIFSLGLSMGFFWLIALLAKMASPKQFKERNPHLELDEPRDIIEMAGLSSYGEVGWLLLHAIKFCFVLPWRLLKFFWVVLRLIHSDKRVICAVDAGVGAAAGYFFLLKPDMDLPAKIAFVLSCALIGGVLGLVSWELVSKRLMGLDKSTPAGA